MVRCIKLNAMKTNRVYVGSTCQPTVAHRPKSHVQDNKRHKLGKRACVTAHSILDTGDYRCTLICKFPCGSKDELTAHEAIWM